MGSRKEVEYVFTMRENGSSTDRRIATFEEPRDVKAVVDRLISETAEGVDREVRASGG